MRIRALAVLGVVGLTLGVAPAYAVSSTSAVAKASSATSLATKAKKPSKPTGVATASGTTSYTVSWKASKTHGTKVTGYQVADRHKKGKHWTAWKTKSVKAKTHKKTIKGTNGSTHQVKVRAKSKKGKSVYTKARSVKVGLPGAVTGVISTNGLKTNAKKIAVSWKSASSHGSAITSYKVYLRHKSGSSWSGWTTKTSAKTLNSFYFRDLSSTGSYQTAIRAVNKNGSGPLSAALAPSLPKISVLTPAPFTGGQDVSVKVSNFPYDQTLITLGVCANDGRVLQGPGDCATTASGGFKFPLAIANGGTTTTLKLPNGALGNSSVPAITCGGGANAGKCAFSATSVSEFFETAPVVVNYANPTVTLTSTATAPYAAGTVVTARISGFPAATTSVRASLCRGDFNVTGAGDCAADASANKAVTLKNGAGTTTLTLIKNLGNTTGSPIDCTDTSGTGCGVIVFNTIFTQYAFATPTYADPSLTLTPSGALTAGSNVTVDYSGFPGSYNMVEVAVCRGDVPTGGPQDCAPLPGDFNGPSNKVVSPVNGGGSATLVVPTGILGATSDPTYNCQTNVAGCIVIVSSFDGLAFAYQGYTYAP